MTTEQFQEKINYLLNDDGGIRQVIERACLNVIEDNGYVQSYFVEPAEDDFILPKQVLTAVLQHLAWNYEPNSRQGKMAVRALKPHVSFVRRQG